MNDRWSKETLFSIAFNFLKEKSEVNITMLKSFFLKIVLKKNNSVPDTFYFYQYFQFSSKI